MVSLVHSLIYCMDVHSNVVNSISRRLDLLVKMIKEDVVSITVIFSEGNVISRGEVGGSRMLLKVVIFLVVDQDLVNFTDDLGD